MRRLRQSVHPPAMASSVGKISAPSLAMAISYGRNCWGRGAGLFIKSPNGRPCASSRKQALWADCHTGMRASQCYCSFATLLFQRGSFRSPAFSPAGRGIPREPHQSDAYESKPRTRASGVACFPLTGDDAHAWPSGSSWCAGLLTLWLSRPTAWLAATDRAP